MIRLMVALAVVIVASVVLANTVFRPAAAADRLAGVTVAVAGYTIQPQASAKSELNLTVRMTSLKDLNECVGFTLDQPFAGRRMTTADGTCARPQAGTTTVQLRYQLSADDLAFPSHTLVWGIPGGRCGPVFEAFGICVVEQAGTAELELPSKSVFPSIGPLGSFFPLFSFEPLP